MNNYINKEFPVTVYGNFTQYSETISRARCRIFYKYLNRNRTYITDEFAEKLLSTISYVPIKGIYDNAQEDYTGHEERTGINHIYGVVPENPNLKWEKHLDEDGVEREYACVDVLIFSSLYAEADKIVGKSQSMEIYPPSIKGEWKMIEGKRVFEYTDGCFLGLQVLGDKVDPCFEGAAFFELYDTLKKLVGKMDLYSMKLPNFNMGGNIQMNKINFKLSDSQKHDAIWEILNPNYNVEGNWTVEYVILDIYSDYALVFNYETGSFERAYYVKDDENDEVVINDRVKVFIVDVTEKEKNALETLRALNGGTYEKIDRIFEEKETLKKENSNYVQKNEELSENLTTLKAEGDQFTIQLETANTQIAELTAELEKLVSYKENVETVEKENVISSYSGLLPEEMLCSYKEKISGYSVTELDKELAYELKKLNVSIFSKDGNTKRVLKDEPKSGIEEILSKYKK